MLPLFGEQNKFAGYQIATLTLANFKKITGGIFIYIYDELDNIFLSYNKILDLFKQLNITTKSGKEITYKDLRIAINIMVKSIQLAGGKVKK